MSNVGQESARVECVSGGYGWSAPERAQAMVVHLAHAKRYLSTLSRELGEFVPAAREVSRQREQHGYDPRKLPCDERIEALLSKLAFESEFLAKASEATGLEFLSDEADRLMHIFSNTLIIYAVSAAWPRAASFELAALVHMHHITMARSASVTRLTDNWTARARRVADVVGPARAQIAVSYGHPGERVSMGKKRTRGHRLAAFFTDDEWPKLRRALGVDRASTPAYEIEKIVLKPDGVGDVVAAFAASLARPQAGVSPDHAPTEAECVRAARAFASAFGYRAPHGAPTAAARELITDGYTHEPTIAALSGAHERGVRKILGK